MVWGRRAKYFELLLANKPDRELPQAFLNPIRPAPHLAFIWSAFWDLSTDRSSGMGVGPIPFSAIDRFAERYGIHDLDDFDTFKALIHEMDGVYLEHASADAEEPVEEGPQAMKDMLQRVSKEAGTRH